MLTVADLGDGGVKNHQKSADVLYGWSPTFNIVFDTIFGHFFDDYMDRRVFGRFRKVFGHFSIQDKKGFAPFGPIF